MGTDDYLYEVSENCITGEAVIMIPLLSRDLSEFETSEAWKNLLAYLPEIQTEEMLKRLQAPRSVAETVGYIRRNGAYLHFSSDGIPEMKCADLCRSERFSFLKSILRRLRKPKDGSS